MSKPKTFRPWLPEQVWLLPPSPIDWLPVNHLVFFLLDLIDQLDLDPILRIYRQKDARGEKACSEVLAFRVLSRNQQPDHTRISEFRRKHLQILEGLFVQVLQLCQKAGLVKLGHGLLDGTKVEALAPIRQGPPQK